MTPDQFVFWLRGYLAGGTVPHDHRVAILAEIDKVQNPAPVAPGLTRGTLDGFRFGPGISLTNTTIPCGATPV